MFTLQELISACAGRLVQGDPALHVGGVSIDTRTVHAHDLFVAIKGDRFDGHDFIPAAIAKGASCILMRAGYRWPGSTGQDEGVAIIEVDDTVKALGSIAAFHRDRFNIPVIAVTGSSGKTTVKEMAAWTLQARYTVLATEGTQNNHIGLPLTLLKLTGRHTAAVVELGTNHPGEIGYLARIAQPTMCVVTNIGPSHLEFFGSLRGVMQEKYSLIEHMRAPAVAVLNHDDPFLQKKVRSPGNKVFSVSFGVRTPSDFTATCLRAGMHKAAFKVNKKYDFALRASGCHNVYNALASIALGRLLGLSNFECARRLRSFNFPKGRGKAVFINKAHFIDDTYNSNPLSLRQSLLTLGGLKNKGRKICVLGDMLELGARSSAFHKRAAAHAAEVCDVLIAVGPESKAAAKSVRAFGRGRRAVFTCDSSLQAAGLLFGTVNPGEHDIVLVKGSRGMKMEQVLEYQNTTT